METPPPYVPPAPPKKKVGLIIGLIVGGIALCCCVPIAVIGGLGFQAKDFAGCLIIGEEAQHAIQLYSKDHNGKLPNAAKWQDELEPYASKVTIRKKKTDSTFGDFVPSGVMPCDAKNGTVLAFNDKLSGANIDSIKDKSDEVMLFEVLGKARNMHQAYVDRAGAGAPKLFMSLPRGWVEFPVEGQGHLNTAQGNKPFGNVSVKTGSD